MKRQTVLRNRRGMEHSDADERPRRGNRPGGSVDDLNMSKLLRPLVRPGTVGRSSLVERLANGDTHRIVAVVAPPGYGKTTLLSQWAERSGKTFAWVSVEEPDNDPKILLTYVAEALDAVEPIGGRVFDALASPGSSVPGSVVPRLGSALSSMTLPVVLVLDDVHVLHDRECRAALSVLADHVSEGSHLVLAGRSEPPLRIPRLRAEGRILEIGPGQLSLNREEASSLLASAGVALGEDEVAELHRRTEGWPVGLYLAALYLREGGLLGSAAISFSGDDRFVTDYVESEFLGLISRRQRVFLTRTAVLERMSGQRGAGPPAGTWATVCPRKRWSTPSPPGTSVQSLAWWRNSGCQPTGKAGSPRSRGGSGGWKTVAGSKDIRWPPCWPRSFSR